MSEPNLKVIQFQKPEEQSPVDPTVKATIVASLKQLLERAENDEIVCLSIQYETADGSVSTTSSFIPPESIGNMSMAAFATVMSGLGFAHNRFNLVEPKQL